MRPPTKARTVLCVSWNASWMSPFNSAEFWNPRIRVPMCLNPAAAESILPLSIKRTEMVLAGLSKAQMIDSIKTGFHNKELPAPAPGAMCYMMSRAGYLNDALGHHVPHLMFYFPLTDKSSWVGLARLARYAESAVSRWSGAHHRVRDPSCQMVRWNGCTVYVGMSPHDKSKLYRNSFRRGKSMNRKTLRTITLRTFALLALLCVARPGRAAERQDSLSQYGSAGSVPDGGPGC